MAWPVYGKAEWIYWGSLSYVHNETKLDILRRSGLCSQGVSGHIGDIGLCSWGGSVRCILEVWPVFTGSLRKHIVQI